MSLSVKEVEGIGPAAVKKLKDADIITVADLATQSIETLTENVGISKDLANKYLQNAHILLREKGLIAAEFIDGNEDLEKRQGLFKIPTGSSKLNEFLYGGIESGAITELFGAYGSGKSQLCHQLAVNVQVNPDSGNRGNCIFIDTESTFRPERIEDICAAKNMDSKEILGNIHKAKVYNSGHLEHIIENLGTFIEKYNAKLVVIDSIIALHRADYTGRGTLADRQQKINAILHRLLRLAEIYKVAVVMTNQITTSPDTFFGDPNKPTGGNIIGHASTYRLYIKKAGKIRKARMIDSPYHEEGECPFQIYKSGIGDVQSSDME